MQKRIVFAPKSSGDEMNCTRWFPAHLPAVKGRNKEVSHAYRRDFRQADSGAVRSRCLPIAVPSAVNGRRTVVVLLGWIAGASNTPPVGKDFTTVGSHNRLGAVSGRPPLSQLRHRSRL